MTKLYHGTNGQWLNHILETGLRPRGSKPGNWKDTVTSNPKCVYLTDSYAPYFAYNAARGQNPSCAVVEIDTDLVDHNNLFPDEDFLEQCSREAVNKVPGTMKQRTMYYRRNQFTYNWPCEVPGSNEITTWWKASLKYLGTCSHRGAIPASAITRAVWWPRKDNLHMTMVWDPQISLMNQSFMGDRYRELTRKLFAGEFTTVDELRAMRAADPLKQPNVIPPIEGWQLIECYPAEGGLQNAGS